MRAVRNSLFLLMSGFLVSGVLMACGGSDSGTNGGGGNGDDNGGVIPEDTTIIQGQIHTVFDSAPTNRLSGIAPRPGATSALQGTPDSAVVGSPGEDGQAGRVATGPATDDSYIIPEGQPGQTGLVIAIIDPDNTPIGGVLILDRTRPDEILINEPINGETTLERAVFQGLVLGNQRIPFGHTNTPQVALVTRFSEDVASSAAMQRAEFVALVEAYEPAQDAMVRGYTAMTGGFDSAAVNDAVRVPAQAYAEARDAGATAAEAHPDFVAGAAAAHASTQGAAEAATAWGTFATIHDHALAGRTTLTRLQSAQNLLMISVAARKELLATVDDGTAGKAEVSAGLDNIMAAGMAAGDMASFMSDVAAAVDAAASDLQAARGSDLSSALSAADLSGYIDTSATPPEIAASLPDYLSGVDSAAGDAALAALLIAVMGGPGYAG